MSSTNIAWHHATVTKQKRIQQNGHGSCVLWLTGLSGSGKSTIANALSHALFQEGIQEYVLDGDNVRHGLNHDLGFSETDRKENIRRIGEVAKLFVDSGTVVITAFISPYQSDRKAVRSLFEKEEFYEIFIDCPLEQCEKRDPKKLYERARRGQIKNFTGIDSSYEIPLSPDLIIPSSVLTVEESVTSILAFLNKKRII